MAVPVYMGLIRLIYLSLQEIEVGGYEIRGTPSSELAFSTSRVRSIVPGAMESDVVTIRAGSISPDLLVLVGDTSGCWPML